MSYVCHGCGTPLVKNWSGHDPKWCSGRCRKRSYGDPCIDCGAKTRYGAETKRIPDPRCSPCAIEHYRRRWTPETIIAAIQAWASEYGEAPAGPDWDPWACEHKLHDPERSRRYREAPGRWPDTTTVFTVFGSWNAAIEAAGFIPRAPHGGNGNQLRSRRQRLKAAA